MFQNGLDGKDQIFECIYKYYCSFFVHKKLSFASFLQLFLGNFQRHIMIKHHLMKPIRATGISFVPQTKLADNYGMRVELYGRKVVEKSSGE